MLNADEILNESLLKLDETFGKPAQVGYDLSIKSVSKIEAGDGMVLKDKTTLNTYVLEEKIEYKGHTGWYLMEGCYDITFNEGCNIALNRVGFIIQRSSLLRNGSLIVSSIFDPGFKTDNMGTILRVNESIFIEENARVAQIYFHECIPVSEDKAYKGQWQGDKQRTGTSCAGPR